MTIITLCMAGAGDKKVLDAGWLGGELFAQPKYQRRDLLYPNKMPTVANASTGKNLLKAELIKIFQADPNALVVFIGHSMGGRVAEKLLREDGGDSGFQAQVPPSRIVFILTGNPERKYNGVYNTKNDYGGVGVPSDTPYRVIDVARQYEYFADHPDNRGNWVAMSNIGSVFSIGKGVDIHKDYNSIFLGDPDNLWKHEGRISYVLSPTFPMPGTWKGLGLARQCKQDRALRNSVEKAYERPWKPPQPTVVKLKPRVGFSATVSKEVAIPPFPTWTPPFG
ncbi:PE-PPE domain-containing protein [Mycolicibacterium gilvum]|uniref:PE-PPE domain-containing protein n=1 Tax=Mycolicibacterium gilvum TaxID=1804 RepID=UPI0040454769